MPLLIYTKPQDLLWKKLHAFDDCCSSIHREGKTDKEGSPPYSRWCSTGSTQPSERPWEFIICCEICRWAISLPISPSGQWGLSAPGRWYEGLTKVIQILFTFFSEAEVILSMKNHRKRKFQDMYSSSLGSSGFFWLCCTQTLCRYMDFSHWHPAVKSLPKTFVSVCLKSRIPYNEEKIKDAKLSTELWQLQNLNV